MTPTYLRDRAFKSLPGLMYSTATVPSDNSTQTIENTLTNGLYSAKKKEKRTEENSRIM